MIVTNFYRYQEHVLAIQGSKIGETTNYVKKIQDHFAKTNIRKFCLMHMMKNFNNWMTHKNENRRQRNNKFL